jgi:hypothetical protein
MKRLSFPLRPGAALFLMLPLALLASCGGPATPESPTETPGTAETPPSDAVDSAASASAPDPDPRPEADSLGLRVADGTRPLTPEEQQQVVDAILQAKAQQQAEGLGKGRVKVNGAWHYSGYSTLAPDPNAAIEARLVAVDITVSGHTEHFDYDDIEIVDGASLVSYGSDPHIEPLGEDGRLLPLDEAIAAAPAPSRWILIYAFPKASPHFHLFYWGRQLTPEALPFSESGLSLPPPAAE